ncbi:Prostaglandin E2 receptor EP3 subtype [Holothuria leucospilota]|uniref:Prostaglandin E2 receptor EP3 subtype n=1 Tax=Holothuria leucospilota TaxID=206669 RepID=A0A9Q1BK35_HOLLE|nr:Prostaglandin E2 receptor EP3 subtype [Holothuria leucospilota]
MTTNLAETSTGSTFSSAEERSNVVQGTIIVVFTVLLIGLLAHIFALLATRKANQLWKEDAHNPVPNFLLNVLLKIDLCAVVFFLLRGIAAPIWLGNTTFRCEFSLSTNLFFTWISGFANVTMCLERCIALMMPFFYRKHATVFRAKMAIATMTVIAFVGSCLPFLGFSSYRIEMDGTYVCLTPGDPNVTGVDYVVLYTIIFYSIGFSTITVIIICNLVVVCYIMKLQRKIAPMRAPRVRPNIPTISTTEDPNESSLTRKQSQNEIRLATVFIIVSIVYTISWLPLYVSISKMFLESLVCHLPFPDPLAYLAMHVPISDQHTPILNSAVSKSFKGENTKSRLWHFTNGDLMNLILENIRCINALLFYNKVLNTDLSYKICQQSGLLPRNVNFNA